MGNYIFNNLKEGLSGTIMVIDGPTAAGTSTHFLHGLLDFTI